MAEGSTQNASPQQKPSDEDKKQVTPAQMQQKAAPPQTSPAGPPAPMARPPPAPAAAAPARPAAPKSPERRGFLKVLFVVGGFLSVVPFVPWGSFLTSTLQTGSGKQTKMQKVVIDDIAKYGPAAGAQVNVNDLTTFPPNDHWVFTYPTSGDASLDAQNPDTFVKYELIRLPEELGGSSKQATDFVAFSKVCVHLWCSPNYNPEQIVNPDENGYQAPGGSSPGTKHEQYECPCHGSIYRIPDGLAIGGPASLQPAPTNAIPMLTLQADSAGNLYAFFPNYDPKTGNPYSGGALAADGELGYGRDYTSYEGFIKPSAQIPANLAYLTEAVS